MSDLYNPSNIPYGVPNAQGTAGLVPGKWNVLTPAGAARCTIVIEGTPTFSRPGIMIEQPGIFGEARAIAVPEDPENSGLPAEMSSKCSAQCQIPLRTTDQPKAGDYIDIETDDARGVERWVVGSVTLSTPANTYWTASIEFTRDPSV